MFDISNFTGSTHSVTDQLAQYFHNPLYLTQTKLTKKINQKINKRISLQNILSSQIMNKVLDFAGMTYFVFHIELAHYNHGFSMQKTYVLVC